MPTSLTCLRCPLTPGSRLRWAWTMVRTSRQSFTRRGRTSMISYQSFRSSWKHTLLSGKTLMIIRWKTARTYSASSTAPTVVRMMCTMFLMSPITLLLTIWQIKCPSGCLSTTKRVRSSNLTVFSQTKHHHQTKQPLRISQATCGYKRGQVSCLFPPTLGTWPLSTQIEKKNSSQLTRQAEITCRLRPP